MSKQHRPLVRSSLMTLAVCATLGAGLAPLTSQAADAGSAMNPPDAGTAVSAPVKAQGVRYVTGGIGADSEMHMRQIAGQWPLRMTFSEAKNDQFVANVKLSITDLKGKPELALDSAGPMTYVKLPAGDYRVYARYDGHEETRQISMHGDHGHDLNFHWNDVG